MGKHSAQFEKRSVTQCKEFPTPKRLVTTTGCWNCAGHPLFCDSGLTDPERMLRPSCCVVRHPTPRFLPPPRLTQSFSQFHSSVPSSSFRLHLSPSALCPPPPPSHPPTHSSIQLPAHTPPNPNSSHATQNDPRTVQRYASRNSTHSARQTRCVRATVAVIPCLHDVHWAAIQDVTDE